MTQKDKDLLLQDLSARLPYGVKGVVTFHKNMTETREEVRIIDGKLYDRFAKFQDSWYDNVTIKPYLFPLSSMTDEQKEEFNSYFASVPYYGDNEQEHVVPYYFVELLIEFFHENHIDNNGLIPMGLAIDATGLNIY